MTSSSDSSPSVLLTGALGGIGRATLRRLARDGWRIAASYAANVESVDAAQRLAGEFPGQVSMHSLDLCDASSIESFHAECVDQWGRLDVLINNAAVGSATVAAYADDVRRQDELMLDINANGPLLLSRLFIAHLRGRWQSAEPGDRPPAKLVNVSSVGGGITVFPGFRLSDGMSKAAIAFMTRQLAAEHVHTPLDVFAVCPGATNTGMFQASTLNPMSQDERERFVQALPKNRLIEPEEIAEVIAFLVGPHSRVMHGAVIDASMGLGSRPGMMTEMPAH